MREESKGRVSGRVDIEVNSIELIEKGREGNVLGEIGNKEIDGVVVGMDIGFNIINNESMGRKEKI